MLYRRFKQPQQRFRLHPPTSLSALLLVLFAALGPAAFHVTPAYAAGITVDSTADTVAGDGTCTLREAINNANADADTTGGDCAAGAGDDTITFGVSGTIGGGSQQLIIENNGKLTIDGGGAITVAGNLIGQWVVKEGADATLAGLTIINGGVYNNGGMLTVSHSTINDVTNNAFLAEGLSTITES
ncbi:MAG: CSLREA domain-containing protein [Caldilineaceae bacterium]